MTHDAYIRGLGFYVPETVVTNADLEKIVETTDEWITTRTGIKERRVAAPGQASSDLALGAAKAALADAGMQADELTHILVYTLTPDFYCPPTACLLEEKLGIRGKFAQDLNAACSGFVYGLETARAIVALHPEAKVLLCAAEVLTSRTNWADRRTCVLFGDGASAAVIAATPGRGSAHIIDARLYSDGSLGHLLTVKGGGSAAPLKLGDVVGPDFFVEMAGQEVFKHAVRNMVSVCEEVLAAAGATTDEVAFLIPHQATCASSTPWPKSFPSRPSGASSPSTATAIPRPLPWALPWPKPGVPAAFSPVRWSFWPSLAAASPGARPCCGFRLSPGVWAKPLFGATSRSCCRCWQGPGCMPCQGGLGTTGKQICC